MTDFIKENYKRLVAEGKTDERIDDEIFMIVGKEVQYKGKTYKIEGDKRIRVIEVKIKKAKEPTPDKFIKVCEECGARFEVSKFNSYFDKCPECRKSKKVHKEPVEKVCDVCGETFIASKFTPYLTTCKSCSKAARNAKARIQQVMEEEKIREDIESMNE